MPRVLVCDDYKDVRYLVAELLRRMGLEVVCAQTGHDSLGSYLDPKIETGSTCCLERVEWTKRGPRLLPGVSFSLCRPALGRITLGGQVSIHLAKWARVAAAPLGCGTNVEAVVAY